MKQQQVVRVTALNDRPDKYSVHEHVHVSGDCLKPHKPSVSH